jgi:hypothetical protein
MDRTSQASLRRCKPQLTSDSTQGRNPGEAGGLPYRIDIRVTNGSWHAAAGGAGDHAGRHVPNSVRSAARATRGANETSRRRARSPGVSGRTRGLAHRSVGARGAARCASPRAIAGKSGGGNELRRRKRPRARGAAPKPRRSVGRDTPAVAALSRNCRGTHRSMATLASRRGRQARGLRYRRRRQRDSRRRDQRVSCKDSRAE